MSSPSGLTAREPALVASAAGAIVAYVLGLLVTHGVLTATQASALTQQVAPMVAALLVIGLGAVIRTKVTPVVKPPPAAPPAVTSQAGVLPNPAAPATPATPTAP